MNIVKYKKTLRVAITASLSIFVAIFTAFLAITLHDKSTKNTMVADSLTSNFASGVGTANNPYLITTVVHLKNFANLVNNGEQFVNKYVKLGANISLLQGGGPSASKGSFAGIGVPQKNAETSYPIFAGKFDGQGYTVSNFSITPPVFAALPGWNVSMRVGGFFGVIAPTTQITNLGLNNFTIYSNVLNNDYVYGYLSYGGVFGFACSISAASSFYGITTSSTAYSAISNCHVSNFEFYGSSQKYSSVLVGGIGGVLDNHDNNVRITNCIVENFNNQLDCLNGGVEGDRVYDLGRIVGFGQVQAATDSNPIIKDCLAAGSMTTNFSSFKGFFGCNLRPYNENEKACKNVYDEGTSGASMTFSNNSSTGGDNGVTWYYSKEYGVEKERNFPVLRSIFSKSVGWKECTITGDNAKVGTSQNPTTNSCTIYIPYDAKNTYSSSGSYDNAKNMEIYDRTIYSGNGGVCHAGDVEWTASSATSYTVKWYPIARQVTINKLSYCTTISYDNSPTVNKMVMVYCGKTVTVSFGSKFLKENAYQTVTITFENTAGSAISYIYTAKDNYYFDSTKINDMYTATNANLSKSDITLHSDLTLNIDSLCVKKDYSIGFE